MCNFLLIHITTCTYAQDDIPTDPTEAQNTYLVSQSQNMEQFKINSPEYK